MIFHTSSLHGERIQGEALTWPSSVTPRHAEFLTLSLPLSTWLLVYRHLAYDQYFITP